MTANKLHKTKRFLNSFCTRKIGMLLVVCTAIFLIAASVSAQESMRFDNEAKKLGFIRQMLSKEKYLRLSEYSHNRCRQVMKDLLANRNIRAIEPYLRADSEDDPRLARWNQCRQVDYHEVGVDPERFFGWLPDLGWPRYRFYRIELYGSPKNVPEDMVYHEDSDEPGKQLGYNQTGYTWVDLEKCETKSGFPATGALSRQSRKPNAVYVNTLVRHKGKLWALDFVDGFSVAFLKRIDRDRMETCQWWLFDPQTATAEQDDE